MCSELSGERQRIHKSHTNTYVDRTIYKYERWITQVQHKRTTMCTQMHTNKYINTNNNKHGANMYKNAHLKTVAAEFSKRREQQPSRTFVRLNMLDYKKATWIDHLFSCN